MKVDGSLGERRTAIRLQIGLEHEIVGAWPWRDKRQVPDPDDGSPWRGFTELKLESKERRPSSSSGRERLDVPGETPIQAGPMAEALPGGRTRQERVAASHRKMIWYHYTERKHVGTFSEHAVSASLQREGEALRSRLKFGWWPEA